MPATGIVDYQDRSVADATTEGKWLRATAVEPTQRPAVHHALAGWIPKVDPNGRGFSWNVALGGYGPGGAPNLTPADTGIYLPPGGSFAYQMHYTPIGKPVTDKTQVGYYFYKEEPKYILRQASITDFSIEIPGRRSASPGDARTSSSRTTLKFSAYSRTAIRAATRPSCASAIRTALRRCC